MGQGRQVYHRGVAAAVFAHRHGQSALGDDFLKLWRLHDLPEVHFTRRRRRHFQAHQCLSRHGGLDAQIGRLEGQREIFLPGQNTLDLDPAFNPALVCVVFAAFPSFGYPAGNQAELNYPRPCLNVLDRYRYAMFRQSSLDMAGHLFQWTHGLLVVFGRGQAVYGGQGPFRTAYFDGNRFR